LALVILACGCMAEPVGVQRPSPALPSDVWAVQKQTIATIERRGGSVRLDKTDPKHPLVTTADLHSIRDVTPILASLGPLTSLTDLKLYDTGFTDADLSRLRYLEALHTLNLSATNVTDAGLAELATLPKLRVLQLNQTRVTEAGLPHLSRLPNLRELGLCGSQITDSGLVELGKMKDLEKLSLGGAAITDRGLDHLKGLRRLRYLFLGHGSRITASAVEDLRVALPQAKILH
jgi:hypothetical protein